MISSDADRISLAVYLDHYQGRHQLYVIIVAVMVGVFASLPFLFTEVSVGSPGILRPLATPTPITSYSSGVVAAVFVRDNMTVGKGDLLINVQSAELDEKEGRAQKRLHELTNLLNDVQEVLHRVDERSDPNWRDWTPQTALYRQWLSDFRQRYRDAAGGVTKALRDHQRSSTLFNTGVIAASEMEAADEALRAGKEAMSRIVQGQLVEWRQVALKYEEEKNDLDKTLSEAGRMKELNQIVAPVNGTVQQLAGLYPGSPVFSGQEVGYISPDTTLVADVHVGPGDIGLLQRGMHVRFQVVAYNYNQWGFLDGEVVEVSDDVVVADDQAYYIVRCKLAKNFLELPDGYRGVLRKGMSVHARFIVGERSLWQLLYDQTDDWLNPHRSSQ